MVTLTGHRQVRRQSPGVDSQGDSKTAFQATLCSIFRRPFFVAFVAVFGVVRGIVVSRRDRRAVSCRGSSDARLLVRAVVVSLVRAVRSRTLWVQDHKGAWHLATESPVVIRVA
jgi:hypothetical protein